MLKLLLFVLIISILTTVLFIGILSYYIRSRFMDSIVNSLTNYIDKKIEREIKSKEQQL